MAEISDYLKGLNKQEAVEESRIQLVHNPILAVLFEKYEQWLSEKEWYDDSGHLVRTLKYTAKDVKDFSLLLKNYESNEWFNWSGNFLSALINTSSEKNFEIITEHLNHKLDFLCYENKKNVIIRGDVGDGVGHLSRSGKIIVQGNVGVYCGGHMTGGELIVEGNADSYVGEEMKGGIIRIKGDAEVSIGGFSKGGEIHIGGELGKRAKEHFPKGCVLSSPQECKAKIYHKGELIWPK